MEEREFIESIDCRFPYSDRESALRLIKAACSISSNAAFAVAQELARPPRSIAVGRDVLHGLLGELEMQFEHPLKSVIFPIARRMIDGEEISVPESLAAMRQVEPFAHQVNALAIPYHACDDLEGEADRAWEEIVVSWKGRAQ